MTSSTTVANQPHAPVQLGLSVVRTIRIFSLGATVGPRPGTACRVAMVFSYAPHGRLELLSS